MSSGFITESELVEARKRKQEEWERVRKAEDPLERPEEPYDHRSLYERLQEQKQKRELEYEEAHKLKNMIKGLDDDEIEFLDLVDRQKIAADRRKELEEEVELSDYRNRVAILQEKSVEERLQAEIVINKTKLPINNHISQQKLLKGVVVKKAESRKRKMSDNDDLHCTDRSAQKSKVAEADGDAKLNIDVSMNVQVEENHKDAKGDHRGVPENSLFVPQSGMKCIAILPGLSNYEDSSSDNSSDSEVNSKPPSRTDLLGRKIEKKQSIE